MNQQPPIINIKMVPAGVELVLKGLNMLPRGESDALWNEIAGQFNLQIQELMRAAQERDQVEKAEAEAAAKAKAAAEKAAKKAAKKVDEPTAEDPLA